MAKKQAKSLQSQYESVRGSFRKKVSIARSKGYDINYNIQKPEKITQSFINRLKKITVEDIQEGIELDDIKVTSYFAGEGIDLRPTRREYEDVIDEIDSATYSEVEQPQTFVPHIPAGAQLEPRIKKRYYTMSPEQLEKEELMTGYLAGGYTKDLETGELEEVVGYRDIDTGKVYGVDDREIFQTRVDEKGYEEIIRTKHGTPFLKPNFIPVSNAVLTAEDYYDVIASNLRVQYTGNYYNPTWGDDFKNWLNDAINKYGAFEVRDMLAKAEDEGVKLDYDFFYNASNAGYEATINTLNAMLATGYATPEIMLKYSEAMEGNEGGFNVDYKNG